MSAQAAEYQRAAPSQPDPAGEPGEGATAVAGRLLSAAIGALDMLAVAIGDRMGYYRLLAEGEALTPPALAAASHTAPRYAREWLEHQAVTGLLEVLDPGREPDARRYRLAGVRHPGRLHPRRHPADRPRPVALLSPAPIRSLPEPCHVCSTASLHGTGAEHV